MDDGQQGLTDLGPPVRSSVDWSSDPRPGSSLDAANMRLGTPRPHRRWRRLSAFAHSLASLVRH